MALVAVVERGTAARSRNAALSIAGKTGTAQNPHGDDHGWFIGYAPAENPQIIVGSVMEFFKHGSDVGPYVARVLSRYVLGPDVPPAAKPGAVAAAARDTGAPRLRVVADSGPPPPVPLDSARGTRR